MIIITNALALLLLFFNVTSSLNVALHAQSRYNRHGWVAGSEITTRGLQRSFEAHPSVDVVPVFAPFAYEGLHDKQWDLVIIEGWIGTVPRFIHEIRRSSPHAKILHFCLDTYPSLSAIKALDVDGFLTNSLQMVAELSQIAPTEHVLLAVDGKAMEPQPVDPRYTHEVVYLGQMSTTKMGLLSMLRAVKDLDLAIYGLGWDRFVESADLLPYWKGVLPVDDIPLLYSSAQVVLATTEVAQRHIGMINNRVFEVLACGAPLITDKFPELVQVLGEEGHVLYVDDDEPSQAYHHAVKILGNATLREEIGQAGRRHVLDHHTYEKRVVQILNFYQQTLLQQAIESASSEKPRVNAPSIGLVSTLLPDKEDGQGLLSVMMDLEKSRDYHISFYAMVDESIERELIAACNSSDLVLLQAQPDSAIETTFRSMPCGPARKGLLVSSVFAIENSTVGCASPMLQYDIIVIGKHDAADGMAELSCHPNLVYISNNPLTVSSPLLTAASSVVPKTVAMQADKGSSGHQHMSMLSTTKDTITSSSVDVGHCSTGDEGTQLRSALDRALYAPPACASISIEWPSDGEVLLLNDPIGADDRSAAPLTVTVRAEAFRMLQDGHWCLQVNDIADDMVCVGDDVWVATIDLVPYLLRDQSSKAKIYEEERKGEVERRRSRVTDLTLQAILKAEGLEYPTDYRISQETHIRVLWSSRID